MEIIRQTDARDQLDDPRERPARPGETCSCGKAAATVYVTTDHGDVPYCGQPSA